MPAPCRVARTTTSRPDQDPWSSSPSPFGRGRSSGSWRRLLSSDDVPAVSREPQAGNQLQPERTSPVASLSDATPDRPQDAGSHGPAHTTGVSTGSTTGVHRRPELDHRRRPRAAALRKPTRHKAVRTRPRAVTGQVGPPSVLLTTRRRSVGEATTSYPASRKTCTSPTEASSQITVLPGGGSNG